MKTTCTSTEDDPWKNMEEIREGGGYNPNNCCTNTQSTSMILWIYLYKVKIENLGDVDSSSSVEVDMY